MHFIKIYSENDLSYFIEEPVETKIPHHLGHYSPDYPVKNLMFREFEKGLVYDWHNAPREQFIIYLEGEVEVTASGGETRIFKAGDVLFACDLMGKGHVTKTLTAGKSIIIVKS